MSNKEYLELLLEDEFKFYIQREYIIDLIDELNDFLANEKNMNDLHFAKRVMFSHELKANNQVEGYCDDLALIEEVIKSKTAQIKNENKRKRILNMYRGYQYILSHHKVDHYHLRDLYQILSNSLIEPTELARMDNFYRTAPVYILMNGRFDLELEQGVDNKNIRRLMKKYFEYYNQTLNSGDMTQDYINSQILHFYFVYIHPYFDVNGRTSRTMAMWHLLLDKAYPYIIFNRGISFSGSYYDKLIMKAKQTHNLTYFIRYMLETVKHELEKEYVMQTIASNTPHKLSGVDYQTILYFLTLKGQKTVNDFAAMYNRLNDKKKVKEIYEEMIVPLIDFDILQVTKYAKSYISGQEHNMFLELNPQKIDDDPHKIKRLILK